MSKFKNIDDLEEWLNPMDYQGFWYAISPYGLVLQDRDHCDDRIKNGGVPKQTVLEVLKGLARIELTERLNLKHRELTPWVKPV